MLDIEPQVTKVNKDFSSERKKNSSNQANVDYNNNDIEFEIKNQNNSNDINNNSIIKKINNISDQVESDIPPYHRNIIFTVFLLTNLFLNYDTGVIPASLVEITKEINLDYSEQALIASLLYLGLSCSSVFVGFVFSRFSPSKVCSIVLSLNCISCFIFSLSSEKNILFAMRFVMGLTEAFLVIYGPVWVNNYSPTEHSATWMGILHSCSVTGVFLGYVVAAVINNFFDGFLSWRFAMQIQGFAEIFFTLFFWFEKDEYINVDVRKSISVAEIELENRDISYPRNSAGSPSFNSPSKLYKHNSRRHDPRIDSIELGNLGRYFLQTKIVLSNILYVSITLGISSIYFIVTGIQFWITKYLIEILGTSPFSANIIFSVISITAPLSGVLFGGTVSDKYGGYKGRNESKALRNIVL